MSGTDTLNGRRPHLRWINALRGRREHSDHRPRRQRGAGVGFRFWPLGIRAEYEYLDIDEVSKQLVGMVSVSFRF